MAPGVQRQRKALDRQHQGLLAQINALQEAMLEGRARDVIGDILANLVRYTETHFAFEIQSLRKHDYPEIATQEAEHAELMRQILEFQEQFRSGKLPAGFPVMRFLRHWLVDHIAGTDNRYGAFLNSRGIF